MAGYERAAQALLNYTTTRLALSEAGLRARTCAWQNRDFWFNVCILLQARMDRQMDILRAEMPSGTFEHRSLDNGA
jgi:hypothetical protein